MGTSGTPQNGERFIQYDRDRSANYIQEHAGERESECSGQSKQCPSIGIKNGGKKMRDIAKEQTIIARLDKLNKVSKTRRKQIQNLCSGPVICTPVCSKAIQDQVGAKPNPIQ